MGLDFVQSEAHWSYSGFMSFRERLANAIGISLMSMQGFGTPLIPWDTINDDIVPLLNHSDCDGVLTPNECHTIAVRLAELIKDWDNGDYDKIQAQHLINGMNKCYENDEPLEFC